MNQKIDEKCFKARPNGDTSLNERICLIIENVVFLPFHGFTYNFVGGSVPEDYLKKNIGSVSLKELKEELGIVIDENVIHKLKLLNWDIGKDNCLKIWTGIQIDRKDIKFVEATHVWETTHFTLLPLNKDYSKVFEIGMWFEKQFKQKYSPCGQYIKVDKENHVKIYRHGPKFKGFIRRGSNGDFLVKLSTNPVLTNKEKDYLMELNKKVNGFEDTKYVFKNDYLCRYNYRPASGKMIFGIRKEFFKNNERVYELKLTYYDLVDAINSNDFRKLEVDSKNMEYNKQIKQMKFVLFELRKF